VPAPVFEIVVVPESEPSKESDSAVSATSAREFPFVARLPVKLEASPSVIAAVALEMLIVPPPASESTELLAWENRPVSAPMVRVRPVATFQVWSACC